MNSERELNEGIKSIKSAWRREHTARCNLEKMLANAEAENAKLRKAVATAIKVQAVLCGDADRSYCRKECPLHRRESDDCLACDVIGVAQELGIEVD